MKNRIIALLLLVASLCVLTACASSRSASTPQEANSVPQVDYTNRGYDDRPASMGIGYLQAEMPDIERSSSSASSSTSINPDELHTDSMSNDYSSKIIYSAVADVETIVFDEAIEMVYELLSTNNGFIESSFISGKDYTQSYYGYQTYRRAEFELRIPRDRFFQITNNLSELGNVTSLRTSADNITMQFFDSESRLSSLRVQEERLLTMLERADTVTEMLDIETSLMQVRYSIESLTSTLQNWQSQVDYSTLTIYLREVQTLTETKPPEVLGYWEEIRAGLAVTISGMGRFFSELFKWAAIYSPIIGIVLIVFIVVIVATRSARRKRLVEAVSAQDVSTDT